MGAFMDDLTLKPAIGVFYALEWFDAKERSQPVQKFGDLAFMLTNEAVMISAFVIHMVLFAATIPIACIQRTLNAMPLYPARRLARAISLNFYTPNAHGKAMLSAVNFATLIPFHLMTGPRCRRAEMFRVGLRQVAPGLAFRLPPATPLPESRMQKLVRYARAAQTVIVDLCQKEVLVGAGAALSLLMLQRHSAALGRAATIAGGIGLFGALSYAAFQAIRNVYQNRTAPAPVPTYRPLWERVPQPLAPPEPSAPVLPANSADQRAALREAMISELELECPISMDTLRDPVVTADGHTYDRGYIARWLTNHATSPRGGNAVLRHRNLVTNDVVASVIQAIDREIHNNPHASQESILRALEAHVRNPVTSRRLERPVIALTTRGQFRAGRTYDQADIDAAPQAPVVVRNWAVEKILAKLPAVS